MNVKKLITPFFVLLIAGSCFGQKFLSDVGFSDTDPCIINLKSGDQVRGVIKSWVEVLQIEKVKFKQDNGEVVLYTQDQITSILVRSGKLAKQYSELGITDELVTLLDSVEVNPQEYLIYESVPYKSKRASSRIMKLMNPHFAGRIRVYYDDDMYYWFIKDRGKCSMIDPETYTENFRTIYPDCQDMYLFFKDIKWTDIATHVYFYNKYCK